MNIATESRWLALPLLLAALPLAAAPPALLLSELAAETGHALSVLRAEAELASAGHELERERAEDGWRIAGSAGYGRIRDVIDVDRTRRYHASEGRVGLTYPLLGTAQKQQQDIDDAALKVRQKQLQLASARQLAQLELELNYAHYWAAQESLELIEAYLASESPLAARLHLRKQNQLLLESQLLDLLSGYHGARSDRLRLQRAKREAASRLEQLAGRPLGEFVARQVALPAPPAVDPAELLEKHPELRALTAQRETLQAQLAQRNWYGVEAGFDVSASTVQDHTASQSGGSEFIGFSVSAPITFLGAQRSERQRLQAELSALSLHQQQRGGELTRELQAAQAQHELGAQQNVTASRRSDAAGAALREGWLRSKAFADESVEQIAARLHAYYGVALQEIAAAEEVWQANITARGFALAVNDQAAAPSAPLPETQDLGARLTEPILQLARLLQGQGAAPAAPPAKPGKAQPQVPTALRSAAPLQGAQRARAVPPATPAAATPAQSSAPRLRPASLRAGAAAPARQPQATASWPVAYGSSDADVSLGHGVAAYVWNSGELLGGLQRSEKFWRGLKRMSINRLLLSLDAAQLRQVGAQPAPLRTFLAQAQRRGVAVELLLGEPGWIKPQERGKLLAIIRGLRGFDFDGLHLDIEPHQLYGNPLSRAEFDQWLATLGAAAQSSPWPTSVDIHPRYFRERPYRDWRLADRLKTAGVREVVLMIYLSDPQRVATIAKEIMSSAPRLRFRVAQSVEPELPPQNSHARRRPLDLQRAMHQLEGLLERQRNAHGIVLQAWADLLRMNYESEIR